MLEILHQHKTKITMKIIVTVQFIQTREQTKLGSHKKFHEAIVERRKMSLVWQLPVDDTPKEMIPDKVEEFLSMKGAFSENGVGNLLDIRWIITNAIWFMPPHVSAVGSEIKHTLYGIEFQCSVDQTSTF
jgi:hypothetical protein